MITNTTEILRIIGNYYKNYMPTITSKEIESGIKNLQTKKSLGVSLVISTKHLINN